MLADKTKLTDVGHVGIVFKKLEKICWIQNSAGSLDPLWTGNTLGSSRRRSGFCPGPGTFVTRSWISCRGADNAENDASSKCSVYNFIFVQIHQERSVLLLCNESDLI